VTKTQEMYHASLREAGMCDTFFLYLLSLIIDRHFRMFRHSPKFQTIIGTKK
jgi:hypothetical protein